MTARTQTRDGMHEGPIVDHGHCRTYDIWYGTAWNLERGIIITDSCVDATPGRWCVLEPTNASRPAHWIFHNVTFRDARRYARGFLGAREHRRAVPQTARPLPPRPQRIASLAAALRVNAQDREQRAILLHIEELLCSMVQLQHQTKTWEDMLDFVVKREEALHVSPS